MNRWGRANCAGRVCESVCSGLTSTCVEGCGNEASKACEEKRRRFDEKKIWHTVNTNAEGERPGIEDSGGRWDGKKGAQWHGLIETKKHRLAPQSGLVPTLFTVTPKESGKSRVHACVCLCATNGGKKTREVRPRRRLKKWHLFIFVFFSHSGCGVVRLQEDWCTRQASFLENDRPHLSQVCVRVP